MPKKYGVALVLCFLINTLTFPRGLAAANLVTAIGSVEVAYYGQADTGALFERTANLEKDLFGSVQQGPLPARVEKIEQFVLKGTAEKPSLVLRVQAVEWSTLRSVKGGALKSRVEQLEQMLIGTITQQPMERRMDQLVALTQRSGKIYAKQIPIPADTLIKVKLMQELNSSKVKEGDVVEYRVAQDVIIDDVLLLPSGSVGYGKVTKVAPPKMFGRNAKLEVDFANITAMDGSIIPTVLGEKAKESTKAMNTAAGASVAGMVLLGPIGIVGGAFVKGEDIKVPAGTELFIQTKEAAVVKGMSLVEPVVIKLNY